MNQEVPLEIMRHSCAHLMAAAVERLFPGAKYGVGPVIENGFYYDFDLSAPLGEADLPRLEEEMRRLKKQEVTYERLEMPLEEAIKTFKKRGQPYKVELLETLKKTGTTKISSEESQEVGGSVESVPLYQTGDFLDLCRGPHVKSAKQIGAFKLLKIAGAYWRGSEKNKMLTRVYATCFPTQEELDKYLWQREEALKRDHRKLGAELKLFMISEEVGPGLVMWLPHGAIIREEIEKLAKEEERGNGYSQVATPHITKGALYERSGHLPYYKDTMFPPMPEEEGDYYLKPMNCPHHHLIYLHEPRSYRDLPLRLAEYGTVYRYEKSGELNGLMRVRGLTMNDAHIYCTAEQIKSEIMKVLKMHERYYKIFNINEVSLRFSRWDSERKEKYIDQPANWEMSERLIKEALEETGLPYTEVKDEAAFYGPKIDVLIKSVIGTEYALSTVQLDFAAGDRFNLRYRGSDGAEHKVFVIHRAPLASHERWIGFLIEHYAGNFPVWLSPAQLAVLPVSEKHNAGAQKLGRELTEQGIIRAILDLSDNKIGHKVRQAALQKVPYILVWGEREEQGGEWTIRVRGQEKPLTMSRENFLAKLLEEIRERK